MNNTSSISAIIVLVDAKTSVELIKYEGPVSFQANIGGAGALLLSMSDLALNQENDLFSDYFVAYKKWLLKES